MGIKIGTPMTEPPPAPAPGLMGEVLAALADVPPGQWLPVEFEKPSHVQMCVTALKKRGLNYVRHGLKVHIQAHVHSWSIGAPNSAGVSVGRCKTCQAQRDFNEREALQVRR